MNKSNLKINNMEQIITSILDTDLYKMTMQYFYIQKYNEVESVYTFNNRSKDMKFTIEATNEIIRQKNLMSNLRLTDREYDWMKTNLPFLPIVYRQYLAAYGFNPNQVHISCNFEGNLSIQIKGKLRDTVLWEVPLMAIISEVYFKMIDTDWSMEGQADLAIQKAIELTDAGCKFADFGSRRRRNFETQDIVVGNMKYYKGFVGTSNPYLAMRHNVKALGTCAHEAIGAVAALKSLNHPNLIFMNDWEDVYQGELGTMLPDTYGFDSFLNDFCVKKAKLWDGLRHDSGDPYEFTYKTIDHYKKLNIDPTTKTIIYSNNLNVKEAIKIQRYCDGRIRSSYGIGTFFTSDFMKVSNTEEKSKPMNMVIKLTEVNGIPVVKLSDDVGKAIGDTKMVEIMKYIHVNNYKN